MVTNVPKVVVLGSTFIDMAVRCSQYPQAGESTSGTSLSYICSGAGPLQAIQAALCGCQVYLISKIGNDPFGQTVKDNLEAHHVNTRFLFTAEPMNTGVTITMVNAEGENATCICCGANSALNEHDIEAAEDVIAAADVCLIHGGLPENAIVAAIRTAKLHDRKVILNPAGPLEQAEQGNIQLPIDYFSVDIMTPNLYEAMNIAEQSSTVTSRREAAKLIGSDLVARGVKTAIITMGRRGAMVIDHEGVDHIPAFEVETVDQTCAGDAFSGALAAYLAVKDDARDAAQYASAAGALACTKFGSLESLPDKADIIQLLQQHDNQ